jgi:translocation and assembly module TamB
VKVTQVALDPAVALKPDLSLDATLARDSLAARLELMGFAERPLTADLSLPVGFGLEPFRFSLEPGAPLRGAVDGAVDLGRALALAPVEGLRVAGLLDLDLGLGGTLARPTVDGDVAMQGGSLQHLATGIDLTDLGLRLEGRGREVALTQLAAKDRIGGTLGGNGTVTLLDDGGVRYRAQVDMARLRVLSNELGTVVLSSDIDAAGTQTGARVGGTVTVESADIAIPDVVGPSIPVIEVTEVNAGLGAVEPAAGPAESSSAPFDLTLDLTINVPARLFVRGRGLDSEWGGTLTVKGPATAPEIVGELEFRRGFLDLLDKRFEIRRGVISFVGSQPPLPMIDLEATARSEEIQAVVRLTGPAANPKLELTSEPVLPQDEILSRLLFGRSVTRLTPVQGLRLAAAVDTLRGGGGLSDVLSTLRKGLGVDTLDVAGGETAQESTAKAGKYVSDNVFVEVERGVAEGSGKARVQVELTPNLSVSTEVDERSQSGIGLEYRYDY